MKHIHIGSIIRQKLMESPLSIAEFASRINRTRTTVYDIFERKSIDVDLLLRISEVLQYNFLEEVYLLEHSKEVAVSEFRSEEPRPEEPRPEECRYIVGVEVDENELMNLPADERRVILKIIRNK